MSLKSQIDINSLAVFCIQSSCNYYRVNFRQQQQIFFSRLSPRRPLHISNSSHSFFIFIYLNNCYRAFFVYVRAFCISQSFISHKKKLLLLEFNELYWPVKRAREHAKKVDGLLEIHSNFWSLILIFFFLLQLNCPLSAY